MSDPTTVGPHIQRGRRLFLRPIVPSDYERLYRFALSPALAYRWRYKGYTPSPETFAQKLWEGALSQYAVANPRDSLACGLVGLYNANFGAQHVSFQVLLMEDMAHRGLGIDASLLMLEAAFRNWPFRKVYFEVPEYNFPQFRWALRFFEAEGRLRENDFVDGRAWDVHIFSLSRSTFEERVGPRYLPLVSWCDG